MAQSNLDYCWDLTVALGKGIYSAGEDIYLGLERAGQLVGFSSQSGRAAEVRRENADFINLLYRIGKSCIDNSDNPLYKCIEIILKKYYSYIPESVLQYLANKAGLVTAKMVGRSVVGAALAKKVASFIFKSIAASAAFTFLMRRLGISVGFSASGVGTGVGLLMFNGLLQRASMASIRLNSQCPSLYQDLKKQNLHLAYFLVEDAMKPYITACRMAEKDPVAFKKTIEEYYLSKHNIFQNLPDNISRLVDSVKE